MSMKYFCPHSQEKLKRATIKNQPVWFSSISKGRMMTKSIARKLIGDHEAQEIWYRAITSKEQTWKPCPMCQREMTFVQSPSWVGTHEIDVCKPCHLLWFENDAFPNLPKVDDFINSFGDASVMSELVDLKTKTAIEQQRIREKNNQWFHSGPENNIERILGHIGFPIEREDIYNFTPPVITYSIIGICVIVFLLTQMDPTYFFSNFGFISNSPLKNFGLNFFSSNFLHGGFMHLFGNLMFFYIFSDDVEETLGRRDYLYFFIFSSFLVGFVSILFNPASIPLVGLSGFVFACLVFYSLDNPKSKILFSSLPFYGPFAIFKLLSRSPISWLQVSSKYLFIYYIIKELLFYFLFEIRGATNTSHLSHIAGGLAGFLAYKMHKRNNDFSLISKQ